VPEAIAFGAPFATGSSGPLFAVLIAMQNLPEAYTSFHDLVEAGIDDGKTLALLAPLALPGPAAALGGFFVLSDAPLVIGTVTLPSAGGILYLVFQRIVAGGLRGGQLAEHGRRRPGLPHRAGRARIGGVRGATRRASPPISRER
jgi:ZIP family zinc transporter